MGMISPKWEEASEQLDRPLTRITLYLHENNDDHWNIEVHSQRERIKEQLHDLQNTMLLFLNMLKRINIYSYDEDGEEELSITMSLEKNVSGNRTLLTRCETRDGHSDKITSYYHVTTHAVIGLASRIARQDSKEKEAKVDNETEVVLAFPLSDDSVPVIEQQEVFAFLPVRRAGFNVILSSAPYDTRYGNSSSS